MPDRSGIQDESAKLAAFIADMVCRLYDVYNKLGETIECFRKLDAELHGTNGNEDTSTSGRGEASFLECELPLLSSDYTPELEHHRTNGNEDTSTSGRGEASFLECKLPLLSSDYTPELEHHGTNGNEDTSTSRRGEESFLESELPVLSSDYAPELIPVITEPAPEESRMANAQAANEGEQNTQDLSFTAWLIEGIEAGDELEETQMEIVT